LLPGSTGNWVPIPLRHDVTIIIVTIIIIIVTIIIIIIIIIIPGCWVLISLRHDVTHQHRYATAYNYKLLGVFGGHEGCIYGTVLGFEHEFCTIAGVEASVRAIQ
jgi:hypothetical protein